MTTIKARFAAGVTALFAAFAPIKDAGAMVSSGSLGIKQVDPVGQTLERFLGGQDNNRIPAADVANDRFRATYHKCNDKTSRECIADAIALTAEEYGKSRVPSIAIIFLGSNENTTKRYFQLIRNVLNDNHMKNVHILTRKHNDIGPDGGIKVVLNGEPIEIDEVSDNTPETFAYLLNSALKTRLDNQAAAHETSYSYSSNF
ncbi:MAG: hypothetical protein KDI13_08890 [Alphaproteobacteria bacterium]|nr:hypothetical protein [Alphaproteobacteria bacterium]